MRAFLFACLAALLGAWACGQSPTGTISGIVFDPDAKAVPGTEIIVVNDLTHLQYETKTNDSGLYTVPNLPPGPYRVQASKIGFKTVIRPDITVNVQDSVTVNFTLPIGATSIAVTVEGGAPMIDTTNTSVSTVVDRNFVENMPLNGRSFQDLILLTPGVVTNSPQTVGPTVGASGEFSVNGQRTESNYYTVDGVSANVGIAPGVPTPGISGSVAASSALGTTQALVSVDALEEFRVQSSTYSAEFGRNPGGQFSFSTRSGGNQWHGTLFDYLRNDVFDANDWFNSFHGLAKPPLRQNDFGGMLGGPIRIPRIYNGSKRSFFFFSYEGLRLLQPQAASISYVPDLTLRQVNTSPALQQVLNAFPLPNDADLGGGVAEFVGTWSNPNQIDAVSVRIDHWVSDKLKLFFRFGETPSTTSSRGFGNGSAPSILSRVSYTARNYTAGATSALSSRWNNELRLNYSSNEAVVSSSLDSFGGATPVNLAVLQGLNPTTNPAYFLAVGFSLTGHVPELFQRRESGLQRQWNVIDTVTFAVGRHQIKAGVDYRRLSPDEQPYSPFVQYFYFSESAVGTNSVDNGLARNSLAEHPLYANFSAFVQDEWKVTSRLNLSVGLRWDVNPAPSASNGKVPYTVANADNYTALSLAPEGTALWKTTWYNFAPRLGAAYLVGRGTGHDTVLRAGAGLFFDTGQQLGSLGFQGPGFSAQQSFGGATSVAGFPLAPSAAIPVVTNPPLTPYGTVVAFSPHLQLPYTLQWNSSVQQELGKSQTLTLSYVGAHGGRLLQENEVRVSTFNPNFGFVNFFRNGLTSDYNALQARFQRSLRNGLQILGSYTWSHSLDYGSQNSALPYIRGNSDFDVRHNVSAAVSYDLPDVSRERIASALLHHWSVDGRTTARTAFPVTLYGRFSVDPATGATYYAGLNLVPNNQLLLNGPEFPGGRAINPAAFQFSPSGQSGDAPRNFVRGFGAVQTDVALRREFPIHERLRLQFRAEAFNVFNHPNFGYVDPNYCSGGVGCTFGQATATLAQSLGVLSPLYQAGGPRSMQFALKVKF